MANPNKAPRRRFKGRSTSLRRGSKPSKSIIVKDTFNTPRGMYVRVGQAGKLNLYIKKDNIGTHWLVTKENKIIYDNYYQRPSIRLLRKRDQEYIDASARSGVDKSRIMVPKDTPTNWKAIPGSIYSLSGY